MLFEKSRTEGNKKSIKCTEISGHNLTMYNS